MTSENTYDNKQKAEEKPQDTPPTTERPWSSQEFSRRLKIAAERLGISYLGTANQAEAQRVRNGEPPASTGFRDFSAIIGGGPPRRRQPTEEASKKEDTL